MISSKSSKKTFLLGCGIALLLLYYSYSQQQYVDGEIVVKTRRLDECVTRISKTIARSVNNYDALEYTIDGQLSARTFFPFAGNGHFGVTNVGQRRLFLEFRGHLQVPVAFDLLLDFSVPGFNALEKIALDFTDGAIHRFACYRQDSMCVTIHHSSIVHRTIPNLLMQELRISNPTSNSVQVRLSRRSSSAANRVRSRLGLEGQGWTDYALLTQSERLPDGQFALLSVAEPIVNESIRINANGFKRLSLVSYVRVGRAKVVDDSALKRFHAASEKRVRPLLLQLQFSQLLAEHRLAWRGLWQRGFSIDTSLAPDALNGDSTNCTLYYLMSNKPINTPSVLLTAYNVTQSIMRPPQHAYDRCYSGHDLFQIRHMWRRPQSGVELYGLVGQWLLTLNKYGCSQLVSAGAGGIAQAVLLAIGEFKFSGNHLEFNMHSSQLVRDMTFRGISYGVNASLNITVEVDDSNKALLFISVASGKTFFACGAACLEREPVRLSSQRTQMPLRITQPRTSMLYVSPDSKHIRSLGRVIHVLDVRDAPAHEHHVIAMHRHGHPLGGLPIVFWIGLGLLLLLFHMFLFKLIYSELCKGEPVIQPYSKNSYL